MEPGYLLIFLNSPLLDPVPRQLNLFQWDPVSYFCLISDGVFLSGFLGERNVKRNGTCGTLFEIRKGVLM